MNILLAIPLRVYMISEVINHVVNLSPLSITQKEVSRDCIGRNEHCTSKR
jgi:hypothetical protein